MNVPDRQVDEELQWALQHARDVAEEQAPRSPWPAIFAEYGNLEAWLDHCRRRRAADPDRKIVRILTSLMHDTPHKPRGTLLWEGDRQVLLADPPLATYWASVSSAGEAGWREERRRIAEWPRSRKGQDVPTGFSDASAIRGLLPLWRGWGQVLLDADASTDFDGAFRRR